MVILHGFRCIFNIFYERPLIFFISFFFFTSNGQERKVTILDQNKNPLSEVGVFAKDKRLATSGKNGEAHFLSTSDSLFFIKSGFENAVLLGSELQDIVILDSLRTMDIEEVEIVNVSSKEILKKMNEQLNKENLYIAPKNWSIFSFLKVEDTELYFLDNHFFWVKNKGRFIENNSNVVKNFTIKQGENNNISYKIRAYSFNNEEFTLPSPKAGMVPSIRHLVYLEELSQDFDKYDFKIGKNEGKIVLRFTPKKNEKGVYLGRIVLDTHDFGIYEVIFNLVKNPANQQTSSFFGKNTHKFSIMNEQFIYKANKKNDQYQFVFSKSDLQLKALNGKIKNKIIRYFCETKSLEQINVATAIPFDLTTFEFKHPD